MRVMSTQEEKHNWDAEKELFSGGVLVSVIDLFPHVQVIVGSRIKFKRHPSNPMEHEERAKHVGDVGECP